MSHVSYSALKIFNECPYRYKLIYEDKLGVYTGTEHTVFGTAIHEAAELKVKDPTVDEVQAFLDKFDSEVAILKENNPGLNETLISEMKEQGRNLSKQILPALKEKFGDFTLLSAEEDIYEIIKSDKASGYDFKGFIDLIIKTPDNKIHIIDWKSCSFGWKAEKKSDKVTTYQLTLYKHFYSQKHGVDLKDIEVYFALLKRTAKKNNVEIFRVTSGKKKMENTFNFLTNSLYNINKKNFPKNKLNCTYCEFYKKKECP